MAGLCAGTVLGRARIRAGRYNPVSIPFGSAAMTREAWKALGYLSVFSVPATLPAGALLGTWTGRPDLCAWFPLVYLFVLLPLLDLCLGRDPSNPRDASARATLSAAPYYRILTLACLPLYAVLLFWSAQHFVHTPFELAGRVGWVLSQGVVGGVVAINVAHELIHKQERVEQWSGGLLLSLVCYAGFKVEHLRGHHVHVATPHDASTARLGQSVYDFVPRAVCRNVVRAFRLEAERLRRHGLPWWSWRNELLWWYGLSATYALAFYLWLGGLGLCFFLGQSVVAFVSLEIINYIEHYGLERSRDAHGRYERVSHRHSWNSNHLLTNLMLFQLQRHSDHHAHPLRRYQVLEHHEDSPQLPAGYATMFVLALLPPLWFRLIDPRVARYRTPLAASAARKPATAAG